MLSPEAYKILELPEGASRAKIRHAYAALSKKYHIETHPEEFSRLHEAYRLALSAAKNADTLKAGEEGAEASIQFPFPSEKDHSTVKTLSDIPPHPKKKQDTSTDSATKKTEKQQNAANHILDQLLGTSFSIQNCCELIQLLYYRCRYDEISPEINAMLLRITNGEQGIMDDLSRTNPEIYALSDSKNFLRIPFRTWKTLEWTCMICHPDFYKAQYTHGFLTELSRFLLEETLNLRDGIKQELYFVICMAYGFFSDKKEVVGETPENLLLKEIEKLLRLHPKHREYIKDLELWPSCQEARRIVLFCQKVYAEFLPETQPVLVKGENNDSSDHTQKTLSETAANLLLDEEIPWKEFIYDCITNFLNATLSGQLSKKREIYHQFCMKREEYLELSELRQEFTRDFINLLDNNIEENYIYNTCYLPLATRLNRIKDRYLTKRDWKKIICRPVFLQKFKNWLLPRHNGFLSVPCVIHYDSWKLLRTCFEGSSAFEMDTIRYLTTEFYFPEYEKRYQKELIWEEAHIGEAYWKETFPIPALSQGKLDLLRTINKATPTSIVEIETIWGNLSFDSDGLDFLTRITNAMAHFNFLLVTQKHEKEAVPGDAFCFLENAVFLYRKKENVLCRLTHPVFYDLISWKFESVAYRALNGKPGYDENFLNTACKNLYCYRCYATHKRDDSSLTSYKE
ncbi:MAG: J domain-containing protein [Lachnospiraceae bacterium]|nr:J domain-containing protein [Lachnospiraceae bacterium]